MKLSTIINLYRVKRLTISIPLVCILIFTACVYSLNILSINFLQTEDNYKNNLAAFFPYLTAHASQRRVPSKISVRVFSSRRVKSLKVSAATLKVYAKDQSFNTNQIKISSIDDSGRLEVWADEKRYLLASPIRIESSTMITAEESQGSRKLLPSPLVVRNTGVQLLITAFPQLDNYIAGVVSGEMPKGSIETLKAQAVAARSYTLANIDRHKDSGYDFCDNTHCQYYRGEVSRDSIYHAASVSTKGLVLQKAGRVVEGVYHSTCGGKTSKPVDVYGQDIFGVTAIEDRLAGQENFLCSASPHYSWEYSIRNTQLINILKSEKGFSSLSSIDKIEISDRDSAGRVIELKITDKDRVFSIKGYDFWQILGYHLDWGKIKSTSFNIIQKDDHIVLKGKGLGHGLGMCQWGAMEMGKKGYNYKQILNHYYPETQVRLY